MGILLRSAVVIGVIVYLSPLRSDKPPAFVTPGAQPESSALSGVANNVWQALPDGARKTMTEEAQKRLIDSARRELFQETAKTGAHNPASPAPGSHKSTQ